MKYRSTTLMIVLVSLGLPAAAIAQTPANEPIAPADAPVAPADAPITPAPDQAQASGATDISRATPPGMPITAMPRAEDPQRDVVEHTWPNRPMLITGLVVLGGTYGASAIVGAASDRKADDKLFIPVVGPWLDLKDRNCDVNACGNDSFNKVLLVGDGALQGIGAVSMLLSVIIPESTKKPWYLIGDEKLSVTPQVGSAVTGLTAFGKF